MKTIKVFNIQDEEFSIEVREVISWGEAQDIEDEIFKGAEVGDNGLRGFDTSVVRKQKYKILETFISSIKNSKGEKVEFSKKWIDNLKITDGNKLYNLIDGLSKEAQKKS